MSNKKISQYTQASSANDNQEFVINNGGVTNKIKWSQMKADAQSGRLTLQDIRDDLIETGAGAPVSTPNFEGQMYIDTTNDWSYIAVGTSSSADWQKTALFASGVTTVTGGGGDVTVSLPFNWTNGRLIVIASRTSVLWADGTVNNILKYETSYEALTNGSYVGSQLIEYATRVTVLGNSVKDQIKSAANDGIPKSATTTSFTLNDNGTTNYTKWFVIA
jgi:hypothetical protein